MELWENRIVIGMLEKAVVSFEYRLILLSSGALQWLHLQVKAVTIPLLLTSIFQSPAHKFNAIELFISDV